MITKDVLLNIMKSVYLTARVCRRKVGEKIYHGFSFRSGKGYENTNYEIYFFEKDDKFFINFMSISEEISEEEFKEFYNQYRLAKIKKDEKLRIRDEKILMDVFKDLNERIVLFEKAETNVIWMV